MIRRLKIAFVVAKACAVSFGPGGGDAILLEDGQGFLLKEDGTFVLLEK